MEMDGMEWNELLLSLSIIEFDNRMISNLGSMFSLIVRIMLMKMEDSINGCWDRLTGPKIIDDRFIR